ncbi:methyltransferase [Pseudomaricurvus alkylphenolicus]|uniref:class I SAM-dependent methyltransferase n=1 Tax=Pseudomaricurvus alkylphenolicus TaxID=1306991 RepID=UPI0014215F6D|nr:SAM-dependent methyltransferase [Pseudomaricurvus alkylphenolicus]NIB40728.1 methyltransferase [Pseudomaricurvus alkylphenolicus]
MHQFESHADDLVSWMTPWVPEANQLRQLCDLPSLPKRQVETLDRLDVSVPGRKWRQIQEFAAAQPPSTLTALEWCAGKGHLGRLLAKVDGCHVISLEWQEQLCEHGQQLADKTGATQQFVCADAFDNKVGEHLHTAGRAIALHACGDLHVELMHHWVQRGGRYLALSPCCYHLIRTPDYRALSQMGQGAKVCLSRDDLKLALQETVTASAGDRRRRQRELMWRLSFDEWQRMQRGVNEYLPTPSIRNSDLSGRFEDFCRKQAHFKQVPWQTGFEPEYWLEQGRKRLWALRRMELVTHLFRRPLETWLVLDRAHYLEEQGAQVTVGTFCEHSLTPRNIMILAEQ